MLNIKPITKERISKSTERMNKIKRLVDKYHLVYNKYSGRYDCFTNFIFEQSILGDDSDILTENGHFIVPFGTVMGDFICTHCGALTNMSNAPKEVIGNFECQFCENLESMYGAPNIVEGTFDCSHCGKLTSLKGAPQLVGKDFICDYCDSLVSLEGVPQIIPNNLSCVYCTNIRTLKDSPQTVNGEFDCEGCSSLESLEHFPKVNGHINIPFHLLEHYKKNSGLQESKLSVDSNMGLNRQNIEHLVDRVTKDVANAFANNKYF